MAVMKKIARILLMFVLLAGICGVCGTITSCKSSSETMYRTKKKNSKRINKNYRVRGNNQRNSSTYHSY